MQRALLIAEKPSLMDTIEAVYKKHKAEIPCEITFRAQRGHLITLAEPDELDDSLAKWNWEQLPIYPENFGGWKHKVIKEKKQGKFPTSQERYKDIQKELKNGSYDFVIHAGDPDREGELLVHLVLSYAQNTLPVKRFWTNDLNERAVLTALLNLRDDDNDPMLVNLRKASIGREHADYLFGMNLSRAASLKMNGRAAVGRVMTPTEAIVVKREKEITNFRPVTKYGVKANYVEGFNGSLFDPAISKAERAEEAAAAERDKDRIDNAGVTWFDTKKEAEDVIATLPNTAEVISVAKKRTSTYAPKLFNLASAQVEAGKMHYSASQTLSILQSCYEKKALTYPRTDCEFISSATDFHGILSAMSQVPELAPYVARITDYDIERVKSTKRWTNDKAMQEAGHSGLTPTILPLGSANLTKAETDIYMMIAKRFLAIFLKPLQQDRVELVARAGDKFFRSAGKTLVDPGYTELFGTSFTDVNVPPHSEGDRLDVKDFGVSEKTTTKPKRYTTAELIAVMNAPGKFLLDDSYRRLGKKLRVGTPATQAPTIEKLLKIGYLTTQKEGKVERLAPTEIGTMIIDNLKDSDITKVDLTGEWETELDDVRLGKLSLEEFEQRTHAHVERLIAGIKDSTVSELPGAKKKAEVVGVCPSCGKRLLESQKGFFCEGFLNKECTFAASKKVYDKTLLRDDVLSLIQGGSVSKTVTYGGRTETVQLKYFPSENKIRVDTGEETAIATCPKCGGSILSSKGAVRCTGGDFKIDRGFLHADFTDEEAIQLLNGEKTVKTLKKDERTWSQTLVYDFKTNRLSFYDAALEGLTETSRKCPLCKKKLSENDRVYACECGLKVEKTHFKHVFTEEELTAILSGKTTDVIEDFWSENKQKTFPASVKIDRTKKRLAFVFTKRKS